MSSHSGFNAPLTNGLEGFVTYMSEECVETFPVGTCLADLIAHWVWSGRGVLNCFGDFEILLKTIPLIVDEWYQHPGILHFGGSDEPAVEPFERHVTSAFGANNGPHPIFNRDHFVAAAFIWQHIEPR
jgi:hypothetical protein